MSTVIKIKNSSNKSQPDNGTLNIAEMAYSYDSDKLFIGENNGTTIVPTVIGGKHFTDMLDHTAGTTTGDSALIVDSNDRINILSIGSAGTHLDFANATITADGSGNDVTLTLAAKGAGTIDVSSKRITSVGTPTAGTDAATKAYVDSGTVTFTNKTFNANGTGNSISNLEVADFAATAIVLESEGITNNDNDTSIPTSAAVVDHVSTAVGNVSSTITVSDGTTTDNFTTGNTLTIQGTANEVEVAVTDEGESATNNATITVGLPDNVTIAGNLTVSGTTTTVNSTTTTLQDPIITLGGGTDNAAPTADDDKDRGVEFQWHNGTDAKIGFFGFDDSTGKFTFIPDATNTSEVFSGTVGDAEFGNLTLGGSIGNYDGAAPTDGQLLIGNTANADFQAGTIAVTSNTGLATPTLGAGTITLAGTSASTQATDDPVAELVTAGNFVSGITYTIVSVNDGDGGADTDFELIGAGDNNIGTTFTANGAGSGTGSALSAGNDYAVTGTNTSLGVASFASEQFTVTSGHVVVTTIDGGEF